MSDTSIDREMASFEVLPAQNNSSGSFPSAEYSFLPEVSTIPNGHIQDNFDMTNMQSALSSTSDLSVDEVHSRLVDLLGKNQSLKEALNMNNSMMKEQMSTISAWREQMILTRNKQQQNLQKALERVAALEMENAELLEKLSNLEKTCKYFEDQASKCSTLEVTVSSLQKEKDSVEKDKKFLDNELKDMNQVHEQLQQSLLAIYHHLDNLLDSNNHMTKDEKEQLKCLIVLLKSKITALEGNFCAVVRTDEETGYEVVHQKVHQTETAEENVAKSEIEDLKKCLEEKSKEVDICKKREQEMAEKIKAYEKRQQESELALKSRYEVMNNKLDIESSLAEKYKERCDSLQSQLEELNMELDKAKVLDDHVVQQLREDKKNLEDILKLEQRANQKDKEKLAEVMEKCEQLQVDYDRVTQLLEIQSKDEKKKNEELDHVTAKLFDSEQKLEEKSDELANIRKQFCNIDEDIERIPILEAQIEIYKKDMEQALAARDSAECEIQKLQNELKEYSGGSPSASVRRRSGHKSKDHSEESEVILCPLCSKGFTSVRAAENHINKCMDEHKCH